MAAFIKKNLMINENKSRKRIQIKEFQLLSLLLIDSLKIPLFRYNELKT